MASLSSAARTSDLRHDQIEIRVATDSDNARLLELTKATPMPGTIPLRIDRDPDFFALLRFRGSATVFVAELRTDLEAEIAGCISVTFQTLYFRGQPETAAYIGDLKVHPRFAGQGVALQLIRAVRALLRAADTDLVSCVVADGNERAVTMLRGGLDIPPAIFDGRFIVDQILASPIAPLLRHGYQLDHAEPQDETEIADLTDRFARSRDFAPKLQPDQACDWVFAKLVARYEGKIVATLELFDPRSMKQNVLLGAPLMIRLPLTLLRAVAIAFPGMNVPRIGEPVALAYVRRFACENNHVRALATLLRAARTIAFRNRFTFLSLALHERDPLRAIVRGLPRLSFSSLSFVASLKQPNRIQSGLDGIPFEDFSLV